MKNKNYIIKTILLLGVLLVVNLLTQKTSIQWDVTQDKRYTIAPQTKQALKQIDTPVHIYVFLQDRQLPAAFKKLQQATKDLLRQFVRESGGKVQFEFENPLQQGSPEEREQTMLALQQRGISPTNLRIKTKNGISENIILPGALVNTGDRQFPVQLLSGQRGQQDINRSIELLEYNFINAITKLQAEKQLTIAFSTGHGELSSLQTNDLREQLIRNFFNVEALDLTKTQDIPEQIDLLVVAKPTEPFSERDKYKIDQFIMHGGKAIFAIDAMKMELDSLKSSWGGKNVAVDYSLNLDDQLFQYGVRMNRNLVRDLQSKPIPIIVDDNKQMQLMPWTFFPVVSSLENHITVKNIDPVSFEFASTLDTLRKPNITSTVLLSSSKNSGVVANPVMIDLEELRNPPPTSMFSLQHLTLAVLLEGNFSSLFQHRAAPLNLSTERLQTSKRTSIAVIADGDILKNTVLPNGDVFPLGYDRELGQQFGNREFMLNLIDYMVNDKHPLQARNKEFTMRLVNQTVADEQRSIWQFLAFAIPLLLLAIYGVVFQLIRKHKYG